MARWLVATACAVISLTGCQAATLDGHQPRPCTPLAASIDQGLKDVVAAAWAQTPHWSQPIVGGDEVTVEWLPASSFPPGRYAHHGDGVISVSELLEPHPAIAARFVAHEVGHLFGLAHHDDGAVMAPHPDTAVFSLDERWVMSTINEAC